MISSDLSHLSTDDLLRKFSTIAQRAGSVFGTDSKKLEQTAQRENLVGDIQAVGAELRKRRAVDEIRTLLASANPDVRCWAGQQFLSIDPEWSTAAMTGLSENLTTAEVLAWRDRILRGAPKVPSLQDMTIAQLLERFVDACERCYGANRFLMEEQGGGLNREEYNKASGEIYEVAKELNNRSKLSALIPLLDDSSAAVRGKAGMYCLDIATENAVAALEALGDIGRCDEAVDAGMALMLWRMGALKLNF